MVQNSTREVLIVILISTAQMTTGTAAVIDRICAEEQRAMSK